VKRISRKRLIEFINKNFIKINKKLDAIGSDIDAYNSKHDGSTIYNEDTLKWLFKKGITEELQNCHGEIGRSCNVGFNPTEQKYYGWSHRAFHGFGIGSECKKGNCSYEPKNKEEFIEQIMNYKHEFHDSTFEVKSDGIEVKSVFKGDPLDKSQDKFIGEVSSTFYHYPETWGRGEYTALTLEDAKEMACAFARSVS